MSIAVILAGKGGDVVSISPSKTLRDAADLLHRRRIGAVIVTNADNALLGIISERDIVTALAREGANALDNPVSRHMTQAVVTAREDDTIERTMERMTNGRFRHVPVLREGQVVGIVSIGDIVKRRVEEYEAEQEALRDYIKTA